MKQRCPSSRFVDIALLHDHKLAFTRRSVTRGCGVADLVKHPGGLVWGVVYEVSDLELGQLDKSEGYRPGRGKNSYWRRECMVLRDGDEARPLTVSTYFGEPEESPPPPSQTYKDLILTGARYWHLPVDYLERLERIEVSP
jgi:hypothetical protein